MALLDRSCLTMRASVRDGSHTQTNSFFITANPLGEKNLSNPIGETSRGCTGKKYLDVSIGEKNATPNPPLVKASSIPWDAITRKRAAAIPAQASSL